MINRPAQLKISQVSLPLPSTTHSPFLRLPDASPKQPMTTTFGVPHAQGLTEAKSHDPLINQQSCTLGRSSFEQETSGILPAAFPAELHPGASRFIGSHKNNDEGFRPEFGGCKAAEHSKLNAPVVCNSEERIQNLDQEPYFDFSVYASQVDARSRRGRGGKLLGQKRARLDSFRPREGASSSIQKEAQHLINLSLNSHQQYEVQGLHAPKQVQLTVEPPSKSFQPGSASAQPTFGQPWAGSAMSDLDRAINNSNLLEDMQLYEEMRHLTNNSIIIPGLPTTSPNQKFELVARAEDAEFKSLISSQFHYQHVVFSASMQAHLAENLPHISPEWPVKVILGQHFDYTECGPPPETVSKSKQFLVYHFKKPRGKADFRIFECLHNKNLLDKCHKKFSNLSKFYDHIRTHTKEKPFVCSICGESFGQRGNLVAHVSQRHLRDRRFPCRLCGQEFSRKNNMRAHERSHLEE